LRSRKRPSRKETVSPSCRQHTQHRQEHTIGHVLVVQHIVYEPSCNAVLWRSKRIYNIAVSASGSRMAGSTQQAP
jgi:hypothetical protein